jgi:hypothetical protein
MEVTLIIKSTNSIVSTQISENTKTYYVTLQNHFGVSSLQDNEKHVMFYERKRTAEQTNNGISEKRGSRKSTLIMWLYNTGRSTLSEDKSIQNDGIQKHNTISCLASWYFVLFIINTGNLTYPTTRFREQ